MKFYVERNGEFVEVSYDEYIRDAVVGRRVEPEYRPSEPPPPGFTPTTPPEWTLAEPVPEGWTPPVQPGEPPLRDMGYLAEPVPEGWTPPIQPTEPPLRDMGYLAEPVPEPPSGLPPHLRTLEDEGTKLSDYFGCAPRVGLLIAFVLVLLAGLWFSLRDDAGCPSAAGAGTVSAAAPDCPDAAKATDGAADSSTRGTAGRSGDLAVFAGRWVLAEGFDDSTGADIGTPVADAHGVVISLDPSSAEIVIEPDGSISGGFFHTSGMVDIGCGPEQRSEVFDAATGAVAATGQGSVEWTGMREPFQCTDNGPESAAGQVRQFWITDDEMIVCRTAMASPTTCAAPLAEVAAVFERA